MCVLHAFAGVQEQFKPFARAECVIFAVARDRHAGEKRVPQEFAAQIAKEAANDS